MFKHTTQEPRTQATQVEDPFHTRFGSHLPRELREEASGMTWSLFSAIYAPHADIRINRLDSIPGRGGTQHFTAELTFLSKTEPPFTAGHTIDTMGTASACTHLLADAGRHVEIHAFHQVELFEATATFVKVAHQTADRRTAWAMGFGPTPAASIAAALSSGAQRIYG
ncbi:hypothetical protein CATRI_11650 [Corynebacterium atrinae]|uniref:acetyl-CoA acetyltransferase n=1 Tax=Corynebacterium atrinae TaxID=1336740 RepID=UPI0025B35BC9|nr:acetyl-CoA acetyltransferase [Corynebacterium atrinae]WJY64379.1 hypothetical protein CATRI_11650 [Corynebacterium atrinae]